MREGEKKVTAVLGGVRLAMPLFRAGGGRHVLPPPPLGNDWLPDGLLSMDVDAQVVITLICVWR